MVESIDEFGRQKACGSMFSMRGTYRHLISHFPFSVRSDALESGEGGRTAMGR